MGIMLFRRNLPGAARSARFTRVISCGVEQVRLLPNSFSGILMEFTEKW
jgi:hypothetical protein